MDEGLKQVVVPGAAGAAGWDYVNEGTAEKPKWGYIASQPGSVLQLQLDVAAGEWTQGPGLKVLGLRVRASGFWASGSGPQGSGPQGSGPQGLRVQGLRVQGLRVQGLREQV